MRPSGPRRKTYGESTLQAVSVCTATTSNEPLPPAA